MNLSSFDLIKRIVVSRKSQKTLKTLAKVTLEVDKRATKPMIKNAFEKIWQDAKVEKIATITVPGKAKTFNRRKIFSPGYKKAVVTLKNGENFKGALSSV